MKHALASLGFCVLVTGVCGQETTPEFSIGGVVVNSKTGEPIQRAQVVLMHFAAPSQTALSGNVPHTPINSSTFTDSAGAFRFNGVSAGRCSLHPEKPGYQTVRDGAGTLNLTASVENVKLSLSPLGVITGKITDQEGQPMRGVNVIALSQRIVEGTRRTTIARNVATDDRGMYRLWNLRPGKYYVEAAGKSGGTYLYAGDTAPMYVSDDAFAPTYFGGGTTMESAQTVNMESGSEVRADLNLKLQPAYKIRGSIGNFVPRRTITFELLSGDEDVSASRVSVNGDTGRFEIQDVLPGSYILHATQNDTSAEVPITVGAGDLEGVAVPLSSAVDLEIHQRLTNPPKASDDSSRFQDAVCNVMLLSPGHRAIADITPFSSGQRQIKSDAQVLSNILPGTYRARTQCFGGYANSVAFGTQDLLANPRLTIQPGVAPPPIEIVATIGGGTISGTLSIENAKASPTVGVLAVPQFTASTGPSLAQVKNSTEFSFSSLAPGRYTVYGFSNIGEVEYRNPTFLQSLNGGIQVDVEENQQTKIVITDLVR